MWLQDDNGLPTRPRHPRVAYHVPEPEKLKYVISNAPENTSIETLLLAASSRWKIERMFEDGKGELGMDPFEIRKFLSIRRHLILGCVSYRFLAEFHQEHQGKNPDLTIRQVRTAAARLSPIWARGDRCSRRRAEWIGRQALRTQQRNARSDRGRRQAARRRLHGIGVCLSDLRTRQWKPS